MPSFRLALHLQQRRRRIPSLATPCSEAQSENESRLQQEFSTYFRPRAPTMARTCPLNIPIDDCLLCDSSHTPVTQVSVAIAHERVEMPDHAEGTTWK